MQAVKEVSSAAYRLRDHEIAQNFLDLFLRQVSNNQRFLPPRTNIMQDVAEAGSCKLNQSIVLVQQSIAERTAYLEEQQKYAANNFVHKPGNHRDGVQYHKSYNGKDILLVNASCINNNAKASTCQEVVNTRKLELHEAVIDIKDHFLKANCLMLEISNRKESSAKTQKDAEKFTTFVDRLKLGNAGDLDVTKRLETIISQTKQNVRKDSWRKFWFRKGSGKSKKDGLEEFPEISIKHNGHKKDEVTDELKKVTATLNRKCGELVALQRALRCFERMLCIQDRETLRCDRCLHEDLDDFELLTACGHLLCPRCLPPGKQAAECIVEGCTANIRDYQKLSSMEMLDHPTSSAQGSKSDRIIDLLMTLVKKKVVIFYHHKEVGTQLKAVLEECGIEVYSSTDIQLFKDKRILKKGNCCVLLLDISNVESAGR
jgi:hypothetical protein